MTKTNIFFIVIDSLRSDRLVKNMKNTITPNLYKLSKRGTLFLNAVTSADGTTLSIGSLFTSLYPFETGLGGNSFKKWDHNIQNHISKLNTLEYETIATVPEPMVSFGLVENFSDFNHTYDVFYRLKDGLGDEILEKLDSFTSKSNWFYYLHLLDLHQPIWVPEELNNEQNGESQYDRMITSIDKWIGKFLEKINLENTIVIVTADHGEYLPYVKNNNSVISFEKISLHKTQGALGKLFPHFMQSIKLKLAVCIQNIRKKQRIKKIQNLDLSNYEKRSLVNSRSDNDCYLYDDLVKIPLLISGPDIPNLEVSKQVRSIDIFPTIFDILDFCSESKHRGNSLLPLLEKKPFEELPCYLESAALIKKSKDDVIGIRTSNYKYFRAINNPLNKIHLFDLINDPLEEYNIMNENSEIVSKMEKLLVDIKTENNDNVGKSTELDDDETKIIEDELRKLGYI